MNRPTVQLGTTPAGELAVHRDGTLVPVQLTMCFPWSEPGRYLSLRDTDERELALVVDIGVLDGESARHLAAAMAASGFVLDVTRVLSVDEEVEIRQWVVETRQGRRTFQTHLDDWPRTLPGGDLLIRDVAGDLYRLHAPAHMDAHSRALLWAFVD
jgi:hypothetical protein